MRAPARQNPPPPRAHYRFIELLLIAPIGVLRDKRIDAAIRASAMADGKRRPMSLVASDITGNMVEETDRCQVWAALKRRMRLDFQAWVSNQDYAGHLSTV